MVAYEAYLKGELDDYAYRAESIVTPDVGKTLA